jgi:hypothetical protein
VITVDFADGVHKFVDVPGSHGSTPGQALAGEAQVALEMIFAAIIGVSKMTALRMMGCGGTKGRQRSIAAKIDYLILARKPTSLACAKACLVCW